MTYEEAIQALDIAFIDQLRVDSYNDGAASDEQMRDTLWIVEGILSNLKLEERKRLTCVFSARSDYFSDIFELLESR